MNLRRVGILLAKEFTTGSKSFMFLFAIVMPIAITLVLNLVFGSVFSGKPKLGIADKGSSQLVHTAAELDSLIAKQYPTGDKLKQAVAAGVVDMGMVLPVGFDGLVKQGESAELTAYIWGESLLKNRAIIGAAMAFMFRDLAGQEAPVEVTIETLGDNASIPWEDRLLPTLVMMGVVFGGIMLPASSLVEEKMKRTLRALVVTPVTLGEVFASKGLMGFILSTLLGMVILMLNQAFGTQPFLLVFVLALGAIMASAFGVLLGAYARDVNSLFAIVKAIGFLLYAPALVYLFPQIPEWIGRLFPTYYFVAPVVEITQQGATWSDVAPEVLILIGLILVLIGAVALVARSPKPHDA